jgi:hypothetical protein
VAKFYRIAKSNPPTVEDFKSYAERGKEKPSSSLSQRRWEGVSMWTDPERARNLALKKKGLGAYLAEVDLPDSVEREQQGHPKHFEVYGAAVDLLACVVDTLPIEKQES